MAKKAAKKKATSRRKATGKTPRRPQWLSKFIAAYRETRSVADACRKVNKARSTVYLYREKFPEFAQEWDDVRDSQVDELQGCSLNRAIDGVLKPIWKPVEKVERGKDEDGNSYVRTTKTWEIVGHELQFDTTREALHLKALRPEQYNRKTHDESGGGSVVGDVTWNFFSDADAVKANALAEAEKIAGGG